MGERKDELLQAAMGYLLEHGVAELSLRPLAKAIGTSARLLIFHFKSKERLLDEVLRQIHGRLRFILTSEASNVPPGGTSSPMKQFWMHATAPELLPYWRLLYEVHFTALQKPEAFAKYLRELSIGWAQIIQSRLPPALRDPQTAILVGAVFDGLMMELLTSGNVRRTTQSLDVFIEMLRARNAARIEPQPDQDALRRRRPRSLADPGKDHAKRRNRA